MARDLICDVCNVEVGVVLVGDLQTGAQTTFCPGCRILDALGFLDQQLNDQIKAGIAAQWLPAPAPAENAEDAEGEAPKRRPGGRRRPQQAGDDPGPTPGPPEAVTAATAAQGPPPAAATESEPAPADDS